MNPHICEYLAYQERRIELAHEGTAYQRAVLFDANGDVRLQVVMFCPYCGEDFRAFCHWQIPGRPQENGILARAREAGEEAARWRTPENLARMEQGLGPEVVLERGRCAVGNPGVSK